MDCSKIAKTDRTHAGAPFFGVPFVLLREYKCEEHISHGPVHFAAAQQFVCKLTPELRWERKKKEQPAWEKPTVPRVRALLAIKPSNDLISYRLL